jgi:hypothetical protein
MAFISTISIEFLDNQLANVVSHDILFALTENNDILI